MRLNKKDNRYLRKENDKSSGIGRASKKRVDYWELGWRIALLKAKEDQTKKRWSRMEGLAFKKQHKQLSSKGHS